MRTGPTNAGLQNLIKELKKKASEQNAGLWKRIASDLERATRSRRVVNLFNINKNAKENEIVVVPGKVLATGALDHNVTVAAYKFSDGALEKINKVGKAITISELAAQNPKTSDVRILG